MDLLTIFSQFLSALHDTTGETPTGMVLPAPLFDRFAEEMGPRCIYVGTDAEHLRGNQVLQLNLPAGSLLIRRVEVTTMRVRL